MVLFKNLWFKFFLMAYLMLNSVTILSGMHAFVPDSYADTPIFSDEGDVKKDLDQLKIDSTDAINDLVLSHSPAEDYEKWVHGISQGMHFCVLGSMTLVALYCYVSY